MAEQDEMKTHFATYPTVALVGHRSSPGLLNGLILLRALDQETSSVSETNCFRTVDCFSDPSLSSLSAAAGSAQCANVKLHEVSLRTICLVFVSYGHFFSTTKNIRP